MSYPLFACGGQAAETASAGAFPDNGEEEVMEDRFQMIGQYLMIRMPEEVDHHQAVILSEKADRYIKKKKVDHIVFDFEDTDGTVTKMFEDAAEDGYSFEILDNDLPETALKEEQIDAYIEKTEE